MENENKEYIILTDENGNEIEFEFLHYLEYNDDEYVVLLPVDAPEESGEIVILKIVPTDHPDEETFVSVDDEYDLKAVFELFKNECKDTFNFID